MKPTLLLSTLVIGLISVTRSLRSPCQAISEFWVSVLRRSCVPGACVRLGRTMGINEAA
jgi:hypothetical protein